MNRPVNIMCIGDVHIAPGYDNKRLTVAGEFCASYQPDYVVFIGDVADMPSLNLHRDRIEAATGRYTEDTECVRDGLSDFMRPIYRAKKKLPQFIVAGGNHENYIRRYINQQDPRLEGTIELERDLGFTKFGFKYFEFQERVPVAGFHFCHNIATKARFSADVNSPKWGFIRKGVSLVTGHTHTKLHLEHTMLNPDGTTRKIHGVNLGCFIHKDMGEQENWSRDTQYTYDRGIWTFDNANDGDARMTFWRADHDLGC